MSTEVLPSPGHSHLILQTRVCWGHQTCRPGACPPGTASLSLRSAWWHCHPFSAWPPRVWGGEGTPEKDTQGPFQTWDIQNFLVTKVSGSKPLGVWQLATQHAGLEGLPDKAAGPRAKEGGCMITLLTSDYVLYRRCVWPSQMSPRDTDPTPPLPPETQTQPHPSQAHTDREL